MLSGDGRAGDGEALEPSNKVWAGSAAAANRKRNGQATKGAGRMPWHQRPKKDAVSCEKLRGVASTHRSADIRMEQSGWFNNQSSYGKYIAVRGEPPELKHLSRARKRNQTRFRE